jgi:hypothetical protein
MTDMQSAIDEELGDRAREFYHQHLKAQLEPAHNGEFVAIDAEAGLWAVGNDPIELHHDLLAQGSRGPEILLRVGYDWTYDMLWCSE